MPLKCGQFFFHTYTLLFAGDVPYILGSLPFIFQYLKLKFIIITIFVSSQKAKKLCMYTSKPWIV